MIVCAPPPKNRSGCSSHPTPMPQRTFVTILILISCSTVLGQAAPTPTPQLQPSVEAVATKSVSDAQAEYYKVQTEQLKERASRQSFWQRLIDNPSSLGALGAVLAAFVALSTFFFNYRSGIRNNRDTQFYESLKRFGDNESATMRCSAAATLSDMGSKAFARTRTPFAFRDRNRYFNLAFTQLTSGLLLEENLVCIDAIRTGLTKLIPDDPRVAITEFSHANLWLKQDLILGFAEFWGALGMTPPTNMQDHHWEEAEHWAFLERRVLKEFTDKTNRAFWKTFESFRQTHLKSLADELGAARHALNIRSHRLQTNVQLFSQALQLIGNHSREVKLQGCLLVRGSAAGAELGGIGMSHSQLHGFDFQRANLSDADFEGTCLRGANLTHARLCRSNLSGANLEDAILQHADLSEAKLSQASINSTTDLSGTKWWQADFLNPFSGTVDTGLLQLLFERDHKSLPSGSNDLHPSVRMFAAQQNVA